MDFGLPSEDITEEYVFQDHFNSPSNASFQSEDKIS